MVEKINIIPLWSNLIPLYIDWIRSKDAEKRRLAELEFIKLGNFADEYNDGKLIKNE